MRDAHIHRSSKPEGPCEGGVQRIRLPCSTATYTGPSQQPQAKVGKDSHEILTKFTPQLEGIPALREWSLREYHPCVYFLVRDGVVVYVGQSIALPGRIASHISNKDFDRVFYLEVPREHLNAIESAFIRALNPELTGSSPMVPGAFVQRALQALGLESLPLLSAVDSGKTFNPRGRLGPKRAQVSR